MGPETHDILNSALQLCERIYELYVLRQRLEFHNLLATEEASNNLKAIKSLRDHEKINLYGDNIFQQALQYVMATISFESYELSGYYDIVKLLKKVRTPAVLPYQRVKNTNVSTVVKDDNGVYQYAQKRDYLLSCFLVYAENYVQKANDVVLLKLFLALKYLSIYLNPTVENNYLQNNGYIDLDYAREKLLNAIGDNRPIDNVAYELANREIEKLLYNDDNINSEQLQRVNVLRGCHLRVCLFHLNPDKIDRLYDYYQNCKDNSDMINIDSDVVKIIEESFSEVRDVNYHI